MLHRWRHSRLISIHFYWTYFRLVCFVCALGLSLHCSLAVFLRLLICIPLVLPGPGPFIQGLPCGSNSNSQSFSHWFVSQSFTCFFFAFVGAVIFNSHLREQANLEIWTNLLFLELKMKTFVSSFISLLIILWSAELIIARNHPLLNDPHLPPDFDKRNGKATTSPNNLNVNKHRLK